MGASAQPIAVTSLHQDMLSLCENGEFRYSIENNSAGLITDVTVDVDLPDGLLYIPGTNLMMDEVDISDLNNPVFTIEDLMPMSAISISFEIATDCAIYDSIQAGSEFRNILRFEHASFGFSYASDPYAIDPALLVITRLEDMTEVTNTTFEREIVISNGRLGRLSSFVFEDRHEPVTLTSSAGTILEETDQLLRIELSGPDFRNIGNGDEYFDLDESITIVETISHDTCEAESIDSEIISYWGCDGGICQTDTGFAEIDLMPTIGRARLRTFGKGDIVECPCLPGGYRQCMVFENIGDASTEELTVDLQVSGLASVTYGGLEGSIRVDSGIATVLDVEYDSLRPIDCSGGRNIFSRATVSLTDIQPGQRIEVCFDLQPCFDSFPAMGGVVEFNWFYGYRHSTECKPFSEVRRPDIPVEIIDTIVSVDFDFLGADENLQLKEDSVYYFKWMVHGDDLLDPGRFLLSVCLPCGYAAAGDIAIPPAINIERTEIIPNDTTTVYNYWIRLPLDTNAFMAQLPITVDCGQPCLQDLGVPQTTEFVTSCEDAPDREEKFGGMICGSGLLTGCPDSLDCGFYHSFFVDGRLVCPDSRKKDTIPGYVDFDGFSRRYNFGSNDDDDDRFEDPGVLDTSTTRLQRLVINDTILAHFEGVVVVDDDTYTFDSLSFNASSGFPIEFVQADFRFRDGETGETFSCSIDTVMRVNVEGVGTGCCQLVITRDGVYSLSVVVTEDILERIGCPIPDFELTDGDSVWCEMLLLNLIHTPVVLRESVVQTITIYDRNAATKPVFSCGVAATPFVYSGMVLNLFPYEDLEVDVCGANESGGSWRVLTTEISDNFFESEFRQLLAVSSLGVVVPDEFRVDSILVTVTYRKDFVDVDTVEHIFPVDLRNGVYAVDSFDLEDIDYDEGYYLDIRPFVTLKNCSVGPADQDNEAVLLMDVRAVRDFAFAVLPNSREPVKEATFESTRDLIIPYPELEIESGPLTINADTRQFCRSVRWRQSEVVEYLALSAEMNVDDEATFDIREMGGLPLDEQTEGLFIAQNVDRGEYFFDVCVQSDTCTEDSLFLDMSWACLKDSGKTELCFDSTIRFEVRKRNAEMEMDLMMDNEVRLCDTTSMIEVRILNGDLGRAYKNELYMSLPLGLDFISEQIEIQYPPGSGWRPLGLPENVGGMIYKWDLSRLLPTSDNGLPGIDSLPSNRIEVRMRLRTSCDLGFGRFLTFWTQGENPCGSLTNTVRKSVGPLRVEGLQQGFQANLQLSQENELCGKSSLIRVEMKPNLPTPGGDVIEVIIPKPLGYDRGSMVSISNIEDQDPAIIDTGGVCILRFDVERSLSSDELVIFEFTVSDLANLECGRHLFSASIYSLGEALCVSTGEPCETRIQNGRDELELLRKGIDIAIEDVVVIDSAGLRYYKIDVKLPGQGDTTGLSTIFELYNDRNMNGLIDSVDRLLISSDTIFEYTAGTATRLCWTSNIGAACSWGVIIKGPCVCMPDTSFYQFNDIPEYKICDTLCSGDTLEIGRERQTGEEFFWNSDLAICDTCEYQVVTIENSSDSVESYIYRLEVMDDRDCGERVIYEIKVSSAPEIPIDTIRVCPGDSVILSAGRQASWFGPGIDGTVGDQITIPVRNDERYDARFTDEYNCPDGHIFIIDPFDVDTSFSITSDTTIIPGDSVRIAVMPMADSVFWTPVEGLNCHDCPDPWASPDSTTTYTATVVDSNGCAQKLNVTVRTAFPPCLEGIFIPNAFTPNGDNINDVWGIRGTFVDEILAVVYDRWGEEVFETRTLGKFWDGTFKGEFLTPDVYAYAVTVTCVNGETVFLKGNVTLLR